MPADVRISAFVYAGRRDAELGMGDLLDLRALALKDSLKKVHAHQA
jgi:hypothetical protein